VSTRERARPLSTACVESAFEIARVAHARETTPERRRPDQREPIGASVEQRGRLV
jgi:hypothetical protein